MLSKARKVSVIIKSLSLTGFVILFIAIYGQIIFELGIWPIERAVLLILFISVIISSVVEESITRKIKRGRRESK